MTQIPMQVTAAPPIVPLNQVMFARANPAFVYFRYVFSIVARPSCVTLNDWDLMTIVTVLLMRAVGVKVVTLTSVLKGTLPISTFQAVSLVQ